MARKARPEEFTTPKDVMNALTNAAIIMAREGSPDIDESKLASHYLPAALALIKELRDFSEQEKMTLAEAALICQTAAMRLTQVRYGLDE